jgi:hypothetical protein
MQIKFRNIGPGLPPLPRPQGLFLKGPFTEKHRL